jgi:hypothetical protein
VSAYTSKSTAFLSINEQGSETSWLFVISEARSLEEMGRGRGKYKYIHLPLDFLEKQSKLENGNILWRVELYLCDDHKMGGYTGWVNTFPLLGRDSVNSAVAR